MSPGDWIMLGSLGVTVEGAVIYGASKAGKAADSIDRLEKGLAALVAKLEDHEKRLNRGGL